MRIVRIVLKAALEYVASELAIFVLVILVLLLLGVLRGHCF